MVAKLAWNELGSASHRNQSTHVVGPLRDGARENLVDIDDAGRCAVEWSAREPLILLELRQSLDQREIRVQPTLDPDDTATELETITYASYTEYGASLVCHVPGVDPDTRHAAPQTIDFTAFVVLPDGTEELIAAANLSDWMRVSVVEGVLGRLSYLLGAEHMRMRQISREVLAMRDLDKARDDALDRIGAAVAVPRFTDEIDYDVAAEEIVTRSETPTGEPVIESDDEYRRRLRIYKPIMVGSRPHILDKLNGNVTEGTIGLLERIGVAGPVDLLETDSPFSVAIHCVGVGGDAIRTNFLQYLRDHYLIAPELALEDDRFLSVNERDRQAELRASVSSGFEFQNNHFIAPMLASALDRVARCRAALEAVVVTQNVLRAQSDNDGSRYELGLGLDVAPLAQAQINALRTALENPARVPADDPDIEGLLQTMFADGVPTFADDPEARWFYQACGLSTVHRLAADRIYLSHLPTAGLAIDGATSVPAEDSIELTAQFHAQGDPGPNAVLIAAMDRAVDDWADAGEAPWTLVADNVAEWEQAELDADASDVFQAAGLPAIDAVGEISERLQNVPPALLTVVRLDAAHAADITAGAAGAIDKLVQLKNILGDAGFVSALPLVTAGGAVILTLSVIGLPTVGSNLAPRRAVGYRWYVVPLQGEDEGSIGAIGSRTTYSSVDSPALVAVVAVGYTRNPDLTDPYEFQVRLPDETRLDITQYEYIMNTLMHIHPIGVEINTWQLRQNHVDLDGDGDADPLGPALARTFRHFRRPRHRGELGVGLTKE